MASVKKEIESETKAYIHAIILLSSLREYLRSMGFPCYIEIKIYKQDGNYKTPDLLIRSDTYLIVDHKYTESKDRKTLTDKLEKMREYNTKFIAPIGESDKQSEFTPEIVMLTPERVVKHFGELLNCPVTWGYKLNEDIIAKQSIGSVKDSRICSLFTPTLLCPKTEEISKFKFVISHPPLAYTACQVYTVLWTLSPPNQFFFPEFEVKYDVILDVFNNLFPPWVRPEIKQLTVSRLCEALRFLQKVGWIRWFEHEKVVIVYRSKGRLIGDAVSYLVDQCVKIEHEKRVKKYEEKVKELEALERPAGQKQISAFFTRLA